MGYIHTALVALAGLAVLANPAAGMPITIPVNCNNVQVGEINAQNNAFGVSGSFSAFGFPLPGATDMGTLNAAAAFCGETQFNWYQVVTDDNQPPKNFAGVQLAAPYVDPQPGGYDIAFDPTWSDNLPWYWDMGAPTPARGQVVNPHASLADNLFFTVTPGYTAPSPDTLYYEDVPGPAPGGVGNGLALAFDTCLVSLNAAGAFQAFDGGFSWTDNIKAAPGGGFTATVGQPAAINCNNVPYQNIIGGFKTELTPEPSTLSMLMMGCLAFGGCGVVVGRRRA